MEKRKTLSLLLMNGTWKSVHKKLGRKQAMFWTVQSGIEKDEGLWFRDGLKEH